MLLPIYSKVTIIVEFNSKFDLKALFYIVIIQFIGELLKALVKALVKQNVIIKNVQI